MANFVQLFKIGCVCVIAASEVFNVVNAVGSPYTVHYLNPGMKKNILPTTSYFDRRLEIFCYRGRPKHIINIWQTALLQLGNISHDKYEQYDGSTPDDVINEYDGRRSSWNFNVFSWKQKDIKLDPFNHSCIGVDTSEAYTVHLNIIRIDYWRVILLGAGILLFVSAQKLSGNALFYYIVGVSFGVCASFLILVYLMSKLLPKKPMMYGFVIGGWTVGVYFIQLLWDNLRLIIMHYQSHVLSYVIFTGLVSFVVCYRLGPVTDHRTKNLIKWALQGASLAMIFFSSHFQEASVAIIVIILVAYNFPATWSSKMKTYWKRKFPPKAELLTEDEYHEQGVKETAKALEELRKYCSSPDCNAWKTVLKLKQPLRSRQKFSITPSTSKSLHVRYSSRQNSPNIASNQFSYRFANFMDGSSHLSDDEMIAYEVEARRTEVYTDSEEESETEEY